MNSPIEALPLPQLCYHHHSQDYWMPDKQAKWIRINESSARRYLKHNGYGESEDIDRVLLQIQQEQNVSYAAKLAGFDAGCHEINGSKVLVTESPRLIEPKAGSWPLLGQILEGMLKLDTVDQRPYFLGWLKLSLESLYARKWTPAQVLAFAGPRNSAKSLLQSLITELFGGRSAKPFLFLTGRTSFNADLFQGEHLMVEDECESSDYRARRNIGANIKQVAVNKNHQCHGKNKDGVGLTPWWRMTISLNDDPERLLVLPPIEDDIEDKIMLFKTNQQSMPMPTNTAGEKELFWQALRAELPAFVDYLLKHEIPQELHCSRFGIKHYHHPDLLQALSETTPGARLLGLIDKALFEPEAFGYAPNKSKEYTSLALENRLTKEESVVSREARQLFTFNNACGSYLAQIAKHHPERVSKRSLHGQTKWTIHPPGDDALPEQTSILVEKG